MTSSIALHSTFSRSVILPVSSLCHSSIFFNISCTTSVSASSISFKLSPSRLIAFLVLSSFLFFYHTPVSTIFPFFLFSPKSRSFGFELESFQGGLGSGIFSCWPLPSSPSSYDGGFSYPRYYFTYNLFYGMNTPFFHPLFDDSLNLFLG